MKYIDAELIKSTKSLYNDIDSCIGELIKARVDHNQENEGKALFRMEGLMVATLQQLDCIIDSLQEEQEVDLDANIEMEWDSFNKHLADYDGESEEVIWLNWNNFNEVVKEAFTAGKKWQAKQLLKGSPLPEDTVLFQKGVEEGKRLLMEEAVEGEVENSCFGIVYLRKNLMNEGYSTGDKVKIIIVKEDDRPRD